MGCNYYAKLDVCPHCGRADEENTLHIGKSSGGWVFSLHVDTELTSLQDWIKFLLAEPVQIVDEYGREVTFQELMNVIRDRTWDRVPVEYPNKWYKSEQEFLDKNQAEWGPNGLLRSRVDGSHCVGHGEGTWDLIRGEFS
jgi:hypothetical protein